jgi:SNF2 family DNA or RNA helicase
MAQQSLACLAHRDNLSLALKVEAVREELARMKARDPSAKAIVFSQFTSMLDILHFRLTQVSRPVPQYATRILI